MPFPTASVVVKLTLPAALLDAVELGGRSHAAVATPVRTNPPAQVARASEVTLQNGTGTVDFGAGVMALATALASGPRVAAEVWHKDAYAEDTLLGAATVSLAPLLREPTLDGYAPVMSDTDPENPGNPRSALLLESEAVKVGELRMVLRLAEKGPLPAWASAQPAAPRPTSAQVERSPREHRARAEHGGQGVHPPRVHGAIRGGGEGGRRGVDVDDATPAPTAAAVPTPTAAETVPRVEEHASASMAAGVADSMASIDSLRKGREYAVAWELEVWKQAQEAKWTASMRAKESERMSALEGEWRRREAQRETEHRKQREELDGVGAKTRRRRRRHGGARSADSSPPRRASACAARRSAERWRSACPRRNTPCVACNRSASTSSRWRRANVGRGSPRRGVGGARGRGGCARRRRRARLPRVQTRAPRILGGALHAEIARLQQQRADAEQTARDATASRDRFKTQIQKMAKRGGALRERTYLRAALTSLGADAAKAAPVRGRAPGEPAPSPTDFASELFESTTTAAAAARGATRSGPRDSIAELEAELRAAGLDENAAVAAQERRGGEVGKAPFSPAEKRLRARRARRRARRRAPSGRVRRRWRRRGAPRGGRAGDSQRATGNGARVQGGASGRERFPREAAAVARARVQGEGRPGVLVDGVRDGTQGALRQRGGLRGGRGGAEGKRRRRRRS